MDITLRLQHDGSLDLLLAGPLVSRIWLREAEPGVYTMHAASYADDPRPGAESAHALLHYLSSGMAPSEYGPPPLPDLTPTAQEQRNRWAALMDRLETPE